MAARKTKPALLVVLAAEVEACKKAGVRFQGLYRAMKQADADKEAALNAVFMKMGFESFEAIKKLSPKKLRSVILKRLGKSFEFENADAANLAILKTWEGTSPAWRDEFLSRLGAAAAAEVEKAAPRKYSYTVIDATNEPGPNVITIPSGGK